MPTATEKSELKLSEILGSESISDPTQSAAFWAACKAIKLIAQTAKTEAHRLRTIAYHIEPYSGEIDGKKFDCQVYCEVALSVHPSQRKLMASLDPDCDYKDYAPIISKAKPKFIVLHINIFKSDKMPDGIIDRMNAVKALQLGSIEHINE